MVLGIFVLMALAVSRATMLITKDRIFLFLRRWVINKFGEESSVAYLFHCTRCASIWLAFPAAVIWATTTLSWTWWWLALPGWFALSYVNILLSRLEEAE